MATVNEAATPLSQELIEYLMDADSKRPTNNAITWVYAADANRVRLATDADER